MKYILLFVLLFTCSLVSGQCSVPGDRFVILQTDKTEFAGLPKNSSPATMNDADFLALDQVLSACINKYNQSHPGNVIKLERYYRQYIVFQNSRGEKEVWVNSFCTRPEGPEWKKEIILVNDGGSCYFNLTINLTKKTFKDFQVNGEA